MISWYSKNDKIFAIANSSYYFLQKLPVLVTFNYPKRMSISDVFSKYTDVVELGASNKAHWLV